MAFIKPSVKQVKVDMTSLKIYIRGEKKTGKSTLFRDTILEKFGDPECGLLIGFGAEVGYQLLDNLNSVQIENYADFKDLMKWLIEKKGTEHKIEMVAFDTVDEMLPILEKEIIRLSVVETKKPCKSLNSSFGGYGAGQEKLKELLKNIVVTLTKSGISPFAIAHTKVKTIKEKGMTDDEAYSVLTGNIPATYDSFLSEIFDVCCILRIDKDIEAGKVTSSVRKIQLRGDGYCDAGSRFATGAVPDFIRFEGDNTAKLFIDTLETGMRNSMTKKVSNEELAKMKDVEVFNRISDAKAFVAEELSVDVELNTTYLAEIKTLFSAANDTIKAEVRNIMSDFGITKFEAETNKTSVLKTILDTLKTV